MATHAQADFGYSIPSRPGPPANSQVIGADETSQIDSANGNCTVAILLIIGFPRKASSVIDMLTGGSKN